MGSVTRLAAICLLITLFVGCNNTNSSNKNELHVTATPSTTDTKDSKILAKSNGETAALYVNWLWSSTWTEHGWLAADGMSLTYLLQDTADKLPAIRYGDDFSVQYKENVSFSSLSIYDHSYQRLHHNVDLSYLDKLTKGTYYIDITVIEQGEYIEEEKENEVKGYECFYKLVVQ